MDFEIVRYLETPLTVEELDLLCQQLGVDPLEIIRTGDKGFRELGLSLGDQRSRADWLEILAQNPRLMQRPIVVSGQRAVVGRPLEAILELL